MLYETVLFRMYDEVEFHGENYGAEGRPPKGTIATIVGIEAYDQYLGRFEASRMKPGLYRCNGRFRLRLADGSGLLASAFEIELLSKTVNDQRRRERIKMGKDPETRTWMGPLPELPIYEGDQVFFLREEGELSGVVTHIRYQDLGLKCNDGVTLMPLYDIKVDGHGFNTCLGDHDIIRVEHGNVWKYYHSEPLVFADLEEEARFHRGMGWVEEVRCPMTDSYNWLSPKNVLEGIRQDLVDGFTMGFSPFLQGEDRRIPTLYGIRFDNRDLGKRVQQKTIEGFKDYREENDPYLNKTAS